MYRQIYHISLLTALAVAALLSSACSADDNGELQSSAADCQPVLFTAAMADRQDATTRSVPNVVDESALKGIAGGFGVFGCYTGLHRYSDVDAQPDFMYNEHVTWDDGESKWTYSPLKYWPNGEGVAGGGTVEAPHYLSFMAYAPYSDMSTGDAGYCIPSMSFQHEVGNPWITYRIHEDVSHQVDLLYAEPILDKTKEAGSMSFQFKHALACAASELTVQCSSTMKTSLKATVDADPDVSEIKVLLTALTITYTLTEKGRLVLWSKEPAYSANWKTINSENPTVTRVVDYSPSNEQLYTYDGSDEGGAAYEDSDHGVFYIPIHVDSHYQTATVSLTYQVLKTMTADPSTPVVDRTQTCSKTLKLSDYPNSYEPGKNLTMSFTLN